MKVEKIFRAEDWWVGKGSLLIGLVYLLSIFFSISFQSFWWWAFLSFVTIVGFASFGYLVNDFFDQEKDALVGKKNFLIGKSDFQKIFLFSFSLSLLLVPWYFLPFNEVTILLIVIQLTAYLLYSIPFARLKERGVIGLMVDSLYAHSIPTVMAAYTYSIIANQKLPVTLICILFCWQFFLGIRNVLLHQMQDLENDKKSGTETFWYIKNSVHSQKILTQIKTIEFSLLAVLLMFLAFSNKFFIISIVSLLLGVVSAYKMTNDSGYRIYFPNIIYEQWLPYSFIIILSLSNKQFLLLIPIQALLFSGVFIEYFYKKIPFKYYFGRIVLSFVYAFRGILNHAKWFGNWLIYLAFRILGVDLVKEKTDAKGYILKKLNKQK